MATAAEQVDLLDLELSHGADADVSAPVQHDGVPLFSYDHETEPMLGTTGSINSPPTHTANLGSMGNGASNPSSSSKSPTVAEAAANAKCWHVQYYQPWFDLDTAQELQRLRKALLPFTAKIFFDKELDEKPDLLSCTLSDHSLITPMMC